MTACSSRICVPPQFYPLHGHYASRSAQFSALPSPWVFTQGTQANLHASRIPGSALQNSQRAAPQASWIPKQILRPFKSFRQLRRHQAPWKILSPILHCYSFIAPSAGRGSARRPCTRLLGVCTAHCAALLPSTCFGGS